MHYSSTVNYWFPNGTIVDSIGDIYMNTGLNTVRLHRRNNAMMPTGIYRCQVPDFNNNLENIYIGIYPVREQTGKKT